MKNKPVVISEVVAQDMCTGCGVCVSECKSKALDIRWNNNGFLVVNELHDKCDGLKQCIKVCPFNPFPEKKLENEDEISKLIKFPNSNFDIDIGSFESIYAGYSKKYRDTSSSGGVASYFLSELIKNNYIDAAIVVNYSNDESKFYNYTLINTIDDILISSKTRYYPVSLSEVLDVISDYDGKLAIVGVGCFIKAIRLKQINNEIFNLKIEFLIGIICGGLKSKYYTDYLKSNLDKNIRGFSNPEYRIKDYNSKASDYSFGVTHQNTSISMKMSKVGDMWGTGFFKATACDFCEDVTTELADVSLGDAWLDPYVNQGKGNNVIIVRSKLAQQIIEKGRYDKNLVIENITTDQLKSSQRGGYNHKHKGLKFRIEQRIKKGFLVPPKRGRNLNEISIYFKVVQIVRNKVRINSTKYWIRYKNINKFNSKIKINLYVLRIVTKIYKIMDK